MPHLSFSKTSRNRLVASAFKGRGEINHDSDVTITSSSNEFVLSVAFSVFCSVWWGHLKKVAKMEKVYRPNVWTIGDWNAFFGFGTNILVNMLVLTGLLRFVLKMPDSLVFGRILPALGLMMCLSTMYYAWLAYRLAQQTGRSDVCALPSGVSVPHMFIVTFVIMLPITLKTADPVKGWSAGLIWVFFQSFILMIGGFIAPYIRKITPRAALLGTLAGVSVTFIAMRPALEMYMTPQIGLVCFAIIMLSWFGGVKYPKNIPAGLVAIAVGMVIAWGSNLFGLGLGGLSVKGD